MVGYLTIISNPPDARVYLDSVDTLKISPASFILENGIHNYRLEIDNFIPIENEVQISEGQYYILDVTLQNDLNVKMVEMLGIGLIITIGAFILKRPS